MNHLEKDLEKIENQMASERFNWFAFRCEVAKELYVDAVKKFPDARDIAEKVARLADILIEELKKIE